MSGDGGTAFPTQPLGSDGLPCWEASRGMSLRDYFAGQAAQGHLGTDEAALLIARCAYEVADAMLAAREAKP